MSLIDVRNLRTWFPVRKGLLQRVHAHVRAVDDVSFTIKKGQTLALVGESGCGKTTVGKSIVRLVAPHEGQIIFQDRDLLEMDSKELAPYRQRIQIVFQDPANSLDPRMLVRDIIAEGIRSFKLAQTNAQIDARVVDILNRVELSKDVMRRYPHEFSGGQRQRICIARALAVEPEFIICDEATSALDVSVQASILNLLKGLQTEMGLTYLFITHDLSVVEYLADQVAVMYLGQIVDEGTTDEIFNNPKHPYTQALIKAAPGLDPERQQLDELLGEVPSPMDPPPGCRFHTRCPQLMRRCNSEEPHFYPVAGGRCRCFIHDPSK
jgi:oligopeptide/dipeptide ABC transporter ATP-binding protein